MSPQNQENGTNCPSCAAPVQDASAELCGYCGARLRLPVAKNDPYQAYQAVAKTYRRQYIWYYLSIGVVVGISMLGRSMGSSCAAKPESAAPISPFSRPPVATPTHTSMGLSHLLGTLTRSNGETAILVATQKQELALVDGRGAKLRWRSEPAQKQIEAEHVLLGDSVAYLVDQTRLSAIRLDDGRTLWQSSLMAELSYGGKDALMLAGGRLLVLQKDGSLQAFDPGTGSPVWNCQIPYRPSGVPRVGNQVIILRTEKAGKRQHTLVDLVDATTGKVLRTLQPQHHDSVAHSVEEPDAQTRFQASADGQELYIIYGSSDRCVERWNPTTGSRLWQDQEKRAHDSSTEYLLGDQILIAATRGEVRAVSRSNGASRVLQADKDYTFVPLVAQKDVVVVQATPSWDTKRISIWGLDATTGKRLWASTLANPEAAGHYTSNRGLKVGMTKLGLAMVQVLGEKSIGVDILDLKTGVSPGRKTVTSEVYPYLLRIENDESQVWYSARGDLYAIDLASGRMAHHLD